MKVELVDLTTPDGLELNGALYPAGEAGTSKGPVEAFVLVHHNGGSLFAPHMRRLGEGLSAAGYAVLGLNNRGSSMVSRTVREPRRMVGSAYEIVDDCRLDLGAAIGWLERERGYERIGLLGHSVGALKVLYYQAHEQDPRVKAVVAMSAPMLGYEERLAGPEGPSLLTNARRAEKLLAEGRGEELACEDQSGIYTARAFLDKFGPANRYYVMDWIGQVKVPVLLLTGSLEGERFSFHRIQRLVDNLPPEVRSRSQAVSIAGAEHFYEKQMPEVLGCILAWLKSLT